MTDSIGHFTEKYRSEINYWYPALISGFIAGLFFYFVGETPPVRSLGLAITIVGVALTVRRLGALFAISCGLALAFSTAFWQQTGPAVSALPETIVFLLMGAVAVIAGIILVSERPYIILMVALALLTVLFFPQIGIARSLRVTVLASAWLIYLLFNAVLETNPRPDGPPPARLKARYRAGLMLLMGIGVINEPLFVLFVPAVILGLALANTRIPWWYWTILGLITFVGLRGIYVSYYDATWFNVSALQLMESRQNVPYLVIDGWHEPARWVDMFRLIAEQFTIVGVVLGVVGVARLARWYPILGGVTMLAWGAFFVFGLLYFGNNREVLLLPLFMLQIISITYAVFVIGQWIEKIITADETQTVSSLRWVTQLIYTALPVFLMVNIIQSVG